MCWKITIKWTLESLIWILLRMFSGPTCLGCTPPLPSASWDRLQPPCDTGVNTSDLGKLTTNSSYWQAVANNWCMSYHFWLENKAKQRWELSITLLIWTYFTCTVPFRSVQRFVVTDYVICLLFSKLNGCITVKIHFRTYNSKQTHHCPYRHNVQCWFWLTY